MAFDYVTLRALAAELRPLVCGRRIAVASSSPAGLELGLGEAGCLHVRPAASFGVVLTPSVPAPGESTPDPGLPYLVGACLVAVTPDARDRILRLRLERRSRQGEPSYGLLIVELFARGGLVVLARQKSGEVLAAWGGGRSPPERCRPGAVYWPPPLGAALLPGSDDLAAFAGPLAASGEDLGRTGARLLAGMDRTTFAEICHRAGVPHRLRASSLDRTAVERVWQEAARVYGAPPSAGAFVWEEDGRAHFSSLEPTRLADKAAWHPSVSEAVRRAQQQEWSGVAQTRDRRRLQERLERAHAGLCRKAAAMRVELAEAAGAEALERQGAILLAWAHRVRAGQSRVLLPDVYDAAGQQEVWIPLDPERTPAENASRYLKSARRLVRRREVLPPLLREAERQAHEAGALADGLARGRVQPEQVWTWLEENGMAQAGAGARRRGSREAHPRRYRTSTGWSVWAGRNNLENDLLTHRLAAQNDLWLHAHGYPGSHVILRREGRPDDPDKRTLEEAAGVAAYWSKGRTARKVAVVYTQAKYVSKPRGSPPGQAILRREKTIMVTPQILPEEDDAA
ncbi:MAG: NFACT RNA binding domain-containing protein [Candidatus Latescibacterota bacterium]